MSFKGVVDAQCPGGCEPVKAEVWSFVRGDRDEALRDRLLAGELNLVICGECGAAFYPEATVVYFDEAAQLLAFVFPDSYRGEADTWRRKMREDFSQMKKTGAFGARIGAPLSFFGFEEIRAVLADEDDLRDEVDVAEFLCRELGLSVFEVDREFARLRRLPRIVPCAGKASERFSRDAARKGLRALLKENPRLASFGRWLEYLDSDEPAPPRR